MDAMPHVRPPETAWHEFSIRTCDFPRNSHTYEIPSQTSRFFVQRFPRSVAGAYANGVIQFGHDNANYRAGSGGEFTVKVITAGDPDHIMDNYATTFSWLRRWVGHQGDMVGHRRSSQRHWN